MKNIYEISLLILKKAHEINYDINDLDNIGDFIDKSGNLFLKIDKLIKDDNRIYNYEMETIESPFVKLIIASYLKLRKIDVLDNEEMISDQSSKIIEIFDDNIISDVSDMYEEAEEVLEEEQEIKRDIDDEDSLIYDEDEINGPLYTSEYALNRLLSDSVLFSPEEEVKIFESISDVTKEIRECIIEIRRLKELYTKYLGGKSYLTYEEKCQRDDDLRSIEQDSLPAKRLKELRLQIKQEREIIFKANVKLIKKISSKYVRFGYPASDMFSYGEFGLLEAIEKFDVSKGFKFSTYATWWIEQSISRMVYDNEKTIRIPVHYAEHLMAVKKFISTMENKGVEVKISDIADAFNITFKEAERDLLAMSDTISLSTPIGEDKETTLADMIPGEASNPLEHTERSMLNDAIMEVLDSITPREKRILELRFGLVDGRARTLEEVGKEFHVTRERIRQIESKALRKLRHPSRAKKLQDYI